MAITRRQFLKGGSLVAAGSLLGPGALLRRAHAALEGNDRYLVVIFLDGGNDGLNTVIPADDVAGLRTAYDAARSNINVTPAQLTNSLIALDPISGTQLGLHPGFNVPNDFYENGAGAGGLKALYDLGRVAVVQGCGYPEYSLSHEESRVIWQTGVPLGSAAGSGWIGRHLAVEYAGNQIPAVNINDSIVGELRQTGTSVLAVRDLERFNFPFDGDYDDDDAAKTAAFSALNQSAVSNGQPSALFIGNTGLATYEATAAYRSLSGLYDGARSAYSQLYSDVGRSLANDLREVARVIYGVEQGVPNVSARFFQVTNGGYDTHSDQGGAEQNGQHFSLHAELGASLKVFYDDLANMSGNVANRVCVLVWSEFSRRIPQNQNGTDHGSQGPMFVIGGGVQGGVYGNHPNIDELALDDEGNTVYRQDATDFRSTDFRDVYGTILQRWVDLPVGTVQGILPVDSTTEALADPAHYWRAANFDLGFLP
jgi:uncharacterized protein (DUF1501 family)